MRIKCKQTTGMLLTKGREAKITQTNQARLVEDYGKDAGEDRVSITLDSMKDLHKYATQA